MNKIVISGFYGFHNIGDEAILRTLTAEIKEMHPDTQITVLSNHPEETTMKFKVKAIDRSNALKVFWTVFRSQVLISGGGSLLQDVTSARSIHYYLSIIKAGILFRKKVVLLSHGIGPLTRESNKKRVRKALNKVDAITVRDYQSAALLREIGVDMSKVSITTDPVMAMPMSDASVGENILKKLGSFPVNRKKIAIAVRQKDFRDAAHLDLLVTLTRQLAETYEVYYLPFYYKNDTKICSDLAPYVGKHVHFVTEKYQSQDFMSLVQNMDLLIGARLHSLIFSLVAEVPFIGISYDPKIENFLDTIERAPVCSISDFDPSVVIKAVEAIFENYSQEREHIVSQKKSLMAKLDENHQILKRML